jgi:hypothetical protein
LCDDKFLGSVPFHWPYTGSSALDGKAVHLTAQVTVVFLGCLEQFHVTVGGVRSADFAEGLHLRDIDGLKAARYLKILTKYFQRIDAANGHCNREADGMAHSHRDDNGPSRTSSPLPPKLFMPSAAMPRRLTSGSTVTQSCEKSRPSN